MAGARPGYLNFTATPAENAESCVSGVPGLKRRSHLIVMSRSRRSHRVDLQRRDG